MQLASFVMHSEFLPCFSQEDVAVIEEQVPNRLPHLWGRFPLKYEVWSTRQIKHKPGTRHMWDKDSGWLTWRGMAWDGSYKYSVSGAEKDGWMPGDSCKLAWWPEDAWPVGDFPRAVTAFDPS